MSTSRANEALQAIPVKVQVDSCGKPDGDAAVGEPVDAFTMNVRPLLYEVRHALDRLVASGDETTIDLGSIPLAPGELDQIDERLGVGEVSVKLDALGPSEIYETRYSGVWRVTHRNATNEVVGRFLEITRMPALLMSQERDMLAGLQSLKQALEGQEI